MHEFLKDEFLREIVFFVLVMLVVVTAALGRPRRLPDGMKFPAPLGARLICWGQLVIWAMLMFASVDLGLYWLAALFSLGPIYTLYHWPETISISELEIRQSALCKAEVRIFWSEIESIELSGFGDSLVLRSHDGRKIRVSSLQVGAPKLISEIEHCSGHICPEFREHEY